MHIGETMESRYFRVVVQAFLLMGFFQNKITLLYISRWHKFCLPGFLFFIPNK